jgi:glycosyltransferase involved in cell wall biosynthesis
VRLPRAALAVFGPGTASGASAAVGLAGGVLALGELEHAAALAVVAGADVFVRPTRADGDALSVREALALGRRVVASAVGHRPSGCLLFPAGDSAALAARLAEASALPSSPRGEAVEPARDPFLDLLEVYRALAGQRPLPRDSAPPREPPPSRP